MNDYLSVSEMSSLCTGTDFWHTFGIPERGIPSLCLSDGPHGLRKQEEKADHLGMGESIKSICFPSAGCLASSFDRDSVFLMGKLLGEEARAEGVHILLGPAMNIKRTPLCGRNFEYYSEDPYLTGELASQAVRGIQSQGVGACVKHYAANNQENGRMVVSAEIDERTLREIYLRAFERVAAENPCAVMSSYNRVNGEYVGESSFLLDDILRGEWGFKGIVISDWYAVGDRVKACLAGLDLEMPGGPAASGDRLKKAAEKDSEIAHALTSCAARVERTAKEFYREKTAGYDRERHHEYAVEMARESAVLLKNRSVFPIQPTEKVLFVGKYANKPRFQGGGSSHINAYRIEGVAENVQDFDIDYFEWCKSDDISVYAEKVRGVGADYDKIIVFCGLPDECESEGYDRQNIDLPQAYNDAIECAAASGKPIGVVLFNGSPVAMPWIDKVGGVLEMGLGGEGAGKACADIITGKFNPCGRLAESYPDIIEHTPAFLSGNDLRKVDYNEGVFVGYRYYATKKIAPLFPFGFGLSYTEFKYSSLSVRKACERIKVSVDVKNVGDRFGKEIVQLYVTPAACRVARPAAELKGFAKVSLEPEEEKTIEFELTARDFAYYDADSKRWKSPRGEYGIAIGKSSADFELAHSVFIEGDVDAPKIDDNTTIGELLDYPPTAAVLGGMLQSYAAKTSDGDAIGDKMKKALLANAPLRLVKAMAKMDDVRYEIFLKKLKDTVENGGEGAGL